MAPTPEFREFSIVISTEIRINPRSITASLFTQNAAAESQAHGDAITPQDDTGMESVAAFIVVTANRRHHGPFSSAVRFIAASPLLAGVSVAGIGDAAAMRRLGLKYVQIDLLRVEQLVAFSRYGLHLAGAVMGLMVLWSVCFVLVTSLLGISMTERTVFVGLLMGITYIGLSIIVFIFPQLGIRERVRAKKVRVSQQLNLLLPTSCQAVALAQSYPQRLAALLTAKADIQAVSEWPTGHLTRMRLTLYLLLPLFSWSGATLVEELIPRQFGW